MYADDAAYFRMVMATDPIAMAHPIGNDVAMGPVRSLINNHRGQFLQHAPDLAYRSHYTPSGIYTGRAWSFTIDNQRVLRILKNIVKGIFYKVYNRPLRQDREIFVTKVQDYLEPREWLEEFSPWEGFGDDVYLQRYNRCENNEDIACYLAFYRARMYFACTRPTDMAAYEASRP